MTSKLGLLQIRYETSKKRLTLSGEQGKGAEAAYYSAFKLLEKEEEKTRIEGPVPIKLRGKYRPI